MGIVCPPLSERNFNTITTPSFDIDVELTMQVAPPGHTWHHMCPIAHVPILIKMKRTTIDGL